MYACGSFLRDECGAVTVDWVALTMGVLLAGIIAVYAIYGNGVASLVDETNGIMLVQSDLDPGPVPDINQ